MQYKNFLLLKHNWFFLILCSVSRGGGGGGGVCVCNTGFKELCYHSQKQARHNRTNEFLLEIPQIVDMYYNVYPLVGAQTELYKNFVHLNSTQKRQIKYCRFSINNRKFSIFYS